MEPHVQVWPTTSRLSSTVVSMMMVSNVVGLTSKVLSSASVSLITSPGDFITLSWIQLNFGRPSDPSTSGSSLPRSVRQISVSLPIPHGGHAQDTSGERLQQSNLLSFHLPDNNAGSPATAERIIYQICSTLPRSNKTKNLQSPQI